MSSTVSLLGLKIYPKIVKSDNCNTSKFKFNKNDNNNNNNNDDDNNNNSYKSKL